MRNGAEQRTTWNLREESDYNVEKRIEDAEMEIGEGEKFRRMPKNTERAKCERGMMEKDFREG